jgi:hypothetical protein
VLLAVGCGAAPEPAKEEAASFPMILYAEPAALDRPIPRRGRPPGAPDPHAAALVKAGRPAATHLKLLPTYASERPTPDIGLSGTLQLRLGCLWIESQSGGSGWPVFPAGSRAFLDRENHLSIAIGREARAVVRAGEELFYGPGVPVEDGRTIAAVRRACGPGALVSLKEPVSRYEWRLNRAAWDAPLVARARGVSVEVARANMLAELRAAETERRRCALTPGPGCARPAPADTWLIPPMPAPPPTPRSR